MCVCVCVCPFRVFESTVFYYLNRIGAVSVFFLSEVYSQHAQHAHIFLSSIPMVYVKYLEDIVKNCNE